MEPEAPKWHSRATVSDLLDRVLDKGLFLRADLVISMAGIPLIGVTLSLALAGTETMLKYGIMSEWDREIRNSACPQSQFISGHTDSGTLGEKSRAAGLLAESAE